MAETLLYSAGIEAYVGEDTNGKYFRKVLGNSFTFPDADQIEREIAVLQNLSHPGIPRLLEASTNGHVELKREYKDGKSLRQLLDEGRTFGREDVLDLALQVLGVLGYAHGKGILHQDVKPSNLIYDENTDTLAVVDWGIAKLRYFSGTTASTINGSLSYMAPEQLKGKSFPSSDLYSLGATLVELLTGKPLDTYVEGESIFEQRVKLPETIDLGLRNVLERLLETDCRRRYQSCAEVVHVFEELQRQPLAYAPRNTGNGSFPPAVHRGESSAEPSVDSVVEQAIKILEDRSNGFSRPRLIETIIPKVESALGYEFVEEHDGFRFLTAETGGGGLSVLVNRRYSFYFAQLKDRRLFDKFTEHIKTYLGNFPRLDHLPEKAQEIAQEQQREFPTPEALGILNNWEDENRRGEIKKEYLLFGPFIGTLVGFVCGSIAGLVGGPGEYDFTAAIATGSAVEAAFCSWGFFSYRSGKKEQQKLLDKIQPFPPEQIEAWKPYHGKILKDADAIRAAAYGTDFALSTKETAEQSQPLEERVR